MGKPLIFNGTNAKLITSGDLLDKQGVPYPRTGKKTYLKASSNTSVGWSTSGTITLTTDTSSSLPRFNTTGSGLKLVSAANGAYAYTRFTLDAADLTRKLGVVLAQATSTANWRVEVWQNSASDYTGTYTELNLSTDSSGDSYLPALTGTYETTFDGNGVSYLELRLVHNGTGSDTLYVSDIVVGPGDVVQGAAVGAWETVPQYTMFTNAAIASPTTNSLKRRRVGDSVQFRGVWGGGTATTSTSNAVTFNMPSGMTIDSTKIASTSERDVVGTAWWQSATPSFTVLKPEYVSSTTMIFRKQGASSLLESDLSTGAEFFFDFTLPIAEWAGSGAVNLAYGDTSQSQPFSFTFDSWHPSSASGTVQTSPSTGVVDISNTAISSSVSSGTLTLTFNKAGYYKIGVSVGHQHGEAYTTADFRMTFGGTATRIGLPLSTVTWATGIDAGDTDLYETHDFIVNATVGQTLTILGKFESGGITSTNSHTAFTTVTATPQPVAGQAVGFAEVVPGKSAGLVSASGLKGRTDGQAVAAGYVGERLSTSLTPVTLSGTTYGSTLGTLSLTAGIWLIFVKTDYTKNTANSGYGVVRVQNTTDSTTVIGASTVCASASVQSEGLVTLTGYVNISSTKSIAVQAYDPNNSGSIGMAINSGGQFTDNVFEAVRIA